MTDAEIDVIYHGLLKDGVPKRKAWQMAVEMAGRGKGSTSRKSRKGKAEDAGSITDIEEVED